jgi:hypothetical protein
MRSVVGPTRGTVIVVLACAVGIHPAVWSWTGNVAGDQGRGAAHLQTSDSRALPDIIGLRPGISLQDARTLLRAHNPKAQLQVGQVEIPELAGRRFPGTLLFKSPALSGTEAPEIIDLELTLPPERPIVWGIVRRLVFEGNQVLRSNLLAQLRQQYGGESYGITMPVVNLYWAFDEEGRRVDTGASFPNCAVPGVWDIRPGRTDASAASSTFPASSLLMSPPERNPGPCRPLVYVKAILQPSGQRGLELIESSTVAVINGALAARAQAATAAHRAAVLDLQRTGGAPKAPRSATPKL